MASPNHLTLEQKLAFIQLSAAPDSPFTEASRAHRIVVLQGGKIVAAGTQPELRARKGRFARLANLQSFQAA